MAIVKEWQCEECSKAFSAIASVCPRCGREARRAFFTPVSINGGRKRPGSARAIDGILEKEFARQGITNFFSGRGAENKVTYSDSGVYSSQLSGAPAQPAISASWVRGGLSNPSLARSLQMDGAPWTGPRDDAAAMTLPGTRVGSGLNPNQIRSSHVDHPD